MTEKLLKQIQKNRNERADKQGILEYLDCLYSDLSKLLKDGRFDKEMSDRLCNLVKEATDIETQSVINAMLNAGINQVRVQANSLAFDIQELDREFEEL